MRPLSSLGIGLSMVSGFLLLALIAELYYLLCWKKRICNRGKEEDCTSPAKELLYHFCWKNPSSLSSAALNPQEVFTSVRIQDGGEDGQPQLMSNSSKDHLLNPFEGEDCLETELMRLYGLSGPPRLLFTINEETKEDLESEDGRSRAGKSRHGSRGSLGDLFLAATESPFLTPLPSPPLFTTQHGFNPLFETSKDEELSRMRTPSPKFKFLRDAEEKLYRKTLMEEALRVHRNVANESSPAPSPPTSSEEGDGSFITLLIGRNREKGHIHSSSSQVIPLASSPSNIKHPHGNQVQIEF